MGLIGSEYSVVYWGPWYSVYVVGDGDEDEVCKVGKYVCAWKCV